MPPSCAAQRLRAADHRDAVAGGLSRRVNSGDAAVVLDELRIEESRRSALPASSRSIRRLYPATSAARMAVSRRSTRSALNLSSLGSCTPEHSAPLWWVSLYEAGQEPLIGWIGAVRPSRRPLSRPPQDEELCQCHPSRNLILRSAQRARLEGRRTVMQPFISILAQPRTAVR